MSESIESIPGNLAQASPYLILVASICALLLTNDKFCLYFFIFYIMLGEIMNHAKKWVFKKILPSTDPWIRPNPPLSGCGIFNDCNAKGSKTFGFPSGHAQMTTFAAVFWSLYLYRQKDWSKTEKISKIVVIWILTALIWYSRVAIGCHNWIQIFGGCFFGALFGYISYIIIEKDII